MATEPPYSPGLLDEIIEACIKHLRDEPKDTEVLFHLGNAFYLKEQFDRGSFCFIKAVNLNPKSPVFYLHLGHTYRKMGDKEQAIAAYESVLTLNPRFADAHFNIGMVFFDNRMWEKARASFDNALNINARYAAARFYTGRVCEEMQQVQRAMQHYRQVIEDHLGHQINPVGVTLNCALIFDDLGLLDQAEREYRNVLKEHPDYADYHYHLGMILKKRGRIDEAMEEFGVAIRLNPQYMEARRKYWEAASG